MMNRFLLLWLNQIFVGIIIIVTMIFGPVVLIGRLSLLFYFDARRCFDDCFMLYGSLIYAYSYTPHLLILHEALKTFVSFLKACIL